MPSMQYDCRLMQDFLPCRPVDGHTDLRAIRVDDRPLVFNVGTDNVLYMLAQIDDDTSTAWSSIPLLASAENESITAFGVAQDPLQSDLFRVAACMTEPSDSNDPSSDLHNVLKVTDEISFADVLSWSQDSTTGEAALWTTKTLPNPDAKCNQVRISRDGHILITTTLDFSDAKYYIFNPDDLSYEEYSLPENGSTILQFALGRVKGKDGAFLLYQIGSDRKMIFKTFPDPKYNRTSTYTYNVPGSVSDFYTIAKADKNDSLYTCGTGVYVFPTTTSMETIVATTDGGMVYDQIRAVSKDDVVSLWLNGSDGQDEALFYITNDFTNDDASTTTAWTTPMPMMQNVSIFACEKEKYISNDLFMVTSTYQLRHLYQDSTTGMWRKESILLDDTDNAVEVMSHIVTARFNSLPVTEKTTVKVTASSTVLCSINESSKVIGPNTAATIEIDPRDPEISLSIPAEDVSVPDVTFFADFLPAEGTTVDCSANILGALKKFDSVDSFKNASVNGEAVFSDGDLPDDETLDTIVQATQEVCKYRDSENSTEEPVGTVSSRSFNLSKALRRRRGKGRKVLTIYFNGDKATFEYSDKKSESITASRGWKFLKKAAKAVGNKFGEVCHAVGEGIVEVATMAVEVVGDVVNVVIDGVREFVLDSIEQVGGFITSVYKMLKVGWEKMKQLIGAFFNFSNIIKTKNRVVSLCNTLIDGFSMSAEYTRGILSKGTGSIRDMLGGDVESTFAAMDNTGVNDPVGGDTQNEAEQEPVSSENNWMGRKMRGSSGASLGDESDEYPLKAEDQTSFEDAFNSALSEASEFADDFQTLFSQLTSGKINFGKFMSECARRIGLTLVNAVEDVGNAILNSLSTFMSMLKSFLNYKIQIPGLSAILSFFGATPEFSLLDVIALIIAVPLNIVCVTFKNTPFHEMVTDTDVSTISSALSTLFGTSTSSRSFSSESHNTVQIASRGIDETLNGLRLAMGVLSCLRVATLGGKHLMSFPASPAPYLDFFKFGDFFLAFAMSSMALVRLELSPSAPGRRAGQEALIAACASFIVGMASIKITHDAFKEFPPAFLLFATFLSFIRLASSSKDMDARVIAGTTCGATNWAMAAVTTFFSYIKQAETFLVCVALRTSLQGAISLLLLFGKGAPGHSIIVE